MRRLGALGVVVVVSLAAAAPAEAAVRPCDRVVKYRYDVTVTGMSSGRETFSGSNFSGDFSLSYDYVARYPRVRVVVDRGCDPEIDTVRALAGGTGTLQNYTWADNAVPKDPDSSRTPCQFGFTTGPLGVRLRLAGGTHVLGGGPATFGVYSSLGLEARELGMLELIDTRRRAACANEGGFNFNVSDGLALHRSVPIFERPARVGGLKVDPPFIFLGGQAVFEGNRNPRVLKLLVAGRSAVIATGVRRYEGTDDASTATASNALTIRFARRR
jgi:hypothetical protein